MDIAIYMLTFVLLLIGLYAIVAKKNVIKIILGVLIIDYAVNLLLVLVGYRTASRGSALLGKAPIFAKGASAKTFADTAVDPLPQAMVLTSIVIGLGLTALMVAIAVRLHEKYETFDLNQIRSLRG